MEEDLLLLAFWSGLDLVENPWLPSIMETKVLFWIFPSDFSFSRINLILMGSGDVAGAVSGGGSLLQSHCGSMEPVGTVAGGVNGGGTSSSAIPVPGGFQVGSLAPNHSDGYQGTFLKFCI